MWATAVVNFEAVKAKELAFQKNERLCVLYGPEDKKWWLIGNKDGQVGWAPTNFLSKCDKVKDSDTARAVNIAVNKHTNGVITKRELDQILRVLGKADDELYECVFACESDEKLVFVSEVNRLVANNLKRDLLSSDLRILARYDMDRSLVLREVTRCNGDVDVAATKLFANRHTFKKNTSNSTTTVASDKDDQVGDMVIHTSEQTRRILRGQLSSDSFTDAFPTTPSLSNKETNSRVDDIMRFGYGKQQAQDALDKANGDVDDALMLLVASS
eukprot:m.63559 g.63559  ORF g.63559 m.63559 type:complete len:272 (+) comp23301_c0_seq1:288-1103(+)